MKVLLADGYPLFREGVKPVLHQWSPGVEITEATDYPSLWDELLRFAEFDLALIDPGMRGMDGVAGVLRIRDGFPMLPLVVLSATQGVEDVQRLLAAGVLGYLGKAAPAAELQKALDHVLAGGIYVPSQPTPVAEAEASSEPMCILTSRQAEVLRELVKGRSNRQIAHVLDVTEGTIKIHLAAIYRTLKVSNRTEAVLAAQRLGLDEQVA